MFQRGSLPYQSLSVPEHSPPGTVVGNVTGAVDADEGSNAIVYYFIAGADKIINLENDPQSCFIQRVEVYAKYII